MKIRIYPPYKCYQTFTDLLVAPFLSTKGFDEFFDRYLKDKPYLCTYRARNAIYHVLVYLKKKFHVKRILVPSYMCNQVIVPIKMSGLKLVFTDINLKTLGVDLKSVKIKDNDVILWSNLFGLKASLNKRELYGKKVFILEDNVTSFRPPSPQADFTFYNFGKGKEISSSEGGLVAVNKEEFNDFLDETKLSAPDFHDEIFRYFAYLFWKLKTYRVIYFFGKIFKKAIVKPGKVIIEDSIQGRDLCICKISKKIAALQLKRMKELTRKSKNLAKLLIRKLKKFDGISIIEPPRDSTFFCVNMYIKDNRNSLLSFLEKEQIFATVPWGYLNNSNYLDRKKSHRKYAYLLDHILQIMVNPSYMKKDDILYIVGKIDEWQKKQKQS
jgi:dTDP-4-amino-4,6-dideoxygalactose transaminase